MCVICRGRFPKAELARYAQGRDGLEPDPGRTAPGRGVYVCARPECLERFRSMAQGKKLKGEIKK
ncbi:MAG: YlxR family protein [Desulfovibrionaceae bacterium]|nr:YlxR family protein [Desulfovibrionaceae bacterium]